MSHTVIGRNDEPTAEDVTLEVVDRLIAEAMREIRDGAEPQCTLRILDAARDELAIRICSVVKTQTLSDKIAAKARPIVRMHLRGRR